MSTDELLRAALNDPDQVRRLCCYLGSKPRLTHRDRDLLGRAIEALTFWDDDGEPDEEDPFTTQIAHEALRHQAKAPEGGGHSEGG